jgi:hypothetical protein
MGADNSSSHNRTNRTRSSNCETVDILYHTFPEMSTSLFAKHATCTVQSVENLGLRIF